MSDDSLPYPYHLGMEFPVMPVPPTPEHCIEVPAGAVTLVVEARDLADERARGGAGPAPNDSPVFDDFGASLHVVGPEGAEYVRFDCFDKEPHYHYIRPAQGTNIIVRLDDVAEGDPIEWTIGRLRDRLPEMLDHAGAHDLADSVRRQLPALHDATETVRELLQEAQRRAVARRATGSTLAPDSR